LRLSRYVRGGLAGRVDWETRGANHREIRSRSPANAREIQIGSPEGHFPRGNNRYPGSRAWRYSVFYTRPTLRYKLLLEYNLLLTQRLTSYPLVLVGLSCGSSSFARVTNELPTSRTVVALHREHLALLVGRLSSVAHLSLPTQLFESKPAAYTDNPAELPL
jgi:hypothetical protein